MTNEKRKLHIHISVENIQEGINFYNTQLQAKPTKIKDDYAQWLMDDLSLNFAISTRGYKKGVNHLGIQYESEDALQKIQSIFEEKGIKGREDKCAVCCYKESNKYWVKDPSDLVWENYHSMEDIEVFGEDARNTVDGCCMPNIEKPSGITSCQTPQNENKCCSS